MSETRFTKQVALLTLSIMLFISAISMASRISPEKSSTNTSIRASGEPQYNTGYAATVKTPSQLIIESQSSSLKQGLPYTGNGFIISFDYSHDEFLVTIRPPYDTSKVNFIAYLQTAGYGNLPKDMFRYIVNPTPMPLCTSWTDFSISNNGPLGSCTPWDTYNTTPYTTQCTAVSGNKVTLKMNTVLYATQMQLINTDPAVYCSDVTAWPTPQPFSSQKSNWTLTPGAGDKKVCGRFTSTSGETVACGGMIHVINPTPTPWPSPACASWTSFYIQGTGGACTPYDPNYKYNYASCNTTSSQTVTIKMSGVQNATQMQLKNVDAAVSCTNVTSWPSPVTFTSQKTGWSLTAGTGDRKVCGRFTNPGGGEVKCGGIVHVIP